MMLVTLQVSSIITVDNVDNPVSFKPTNVLLSFTFSLWVSQSFTDLLLKQNFAMSSPTLLCNFSG